MAYPFSGGQQSLARSASQQGADGRRDIGPRPSSSRRCTRPGTRSLDRFPMTCWQEAFWEGSGAARGCFEKKNRIEVAVRSLHDRRGTFALRELIARMAARTLQVSVAPIPRQRSACTGRVEGERTLPAR